MSTTDYTLPPLPLPAAAAFAPQVEAYGQACAEAARAPLLARIDEFETARGAWLAAQAVNQRTIDRLRAEVEDWRKLLDPANLHVNLLQGKPSRLTKDQLAHLLGQDYTELLAEVEALRNRCQQAHDAILSGESDAEVLARLDFWTAAQRGEGE